MSAAHKQRVAAAFDHAEDYDRHAVLQRQTAQWLAEDMLGLGLGPKARILEIGCGTGFVAEAAAHRLARADWLMTDIAPAMIARARAKLGMSPHFRYCVMDGEEPRIAQHELFDLVCSNLTVQWFAKPDRSLKQLFRLVKPGGHLIFTTLAEGTLEEWRKAHVACGVAPGTPCYPAAEALRAVRLDAVGGSVKVRDFAQRFASASEFLRALRKIGAGTPAPSHMPLAAPMMRAVMRRFEAQGAEARYRVALCRFHRAAAATRTAPL